MRSTYANVLRAAGHVAEHSSLDSASAYQAVADLLVLCATAETSRACSGFLTAYSSQHPHTPILVISDSAGEELAVASLRRRVSEYFVAPVEPSDLMRAAMQSLRKVPSARNGPAPLSADLIGSSRSMQQVRDYVPLAAQADCPVLITGETGTGKDLVAQSLHAASPRANKTFVALNCAAVPEMLLESELFGYERGAFTGAAGTRDGKMREAHGGTLFLDEVGELGLVAQAKILRAIETKEVQRLGGHGTSPADFRVIAATNQELESLVAARIFRQDLFFRLNVARIKLKPLREHPEDIPALLEHYLDVFNRKTGQFVQGFSPAALDALCRYSWPGNVRELRNTMEAMLIVRPWPVVDLQHVPEHVVSVVSAGPTESFDEDRTRLMHALRITNWNKSRAARSLRWSRMTLYRKMAKYGIDCTALTS